MDRSITMYMVQVFKRAVLHLKDVWLSSNGTGPKNITPKWFPLQGSIVLLSSSLLNVTVNSVAGGLKAKSSGNN